jgi:hypothetical protein
MNEIEKQERMVWLEKEVERLKELVELQKQKIITQKLIISSLKLQIVEEGL